MSVQFLTNLIVCPLLLCLSTNAEKTDLNYKQMIEIAQITDKSTNSSENVDYAVDENFYFIGCGDEFTIITSQMPLVHYEGTVNQNIDLFIPKLGLIKIGKVSLADAKRIIIDSLSKKLKKDDIYVSFKKVKVATISINGNVASPGTFQHPGYLKLMDVIVAANKKQLPSLNDCDFRSIRCATKDTIVYYDLLKYILTGDLSQNPYIYPGDNFTIELANRSVFVSGAVKSIVSGSIPIKNNETLDSLLALFKLDASADSGKVIVQTTDDNQPRTLHLNSDQYSDYKLKDRDLVVIPEKENYPEILTVSALGELARPGLYPISKGQTKVEDIIKMAGNITQNGNPERIVVIRRDKTLQKESVTTSIRPEVSTSMISMSVANDFAIINISDNKEVILQSGDQVFVPKKEFYVYVSGCVKKPGGYEYKSGEPMKYYIKQAGGLGKKADKPNIYVVTRYSDILQTTDGKTIQEGNIIVVPISQQNKTLSTVILPIIQAAATTLGVLVAIYATVFK